MNLRKKLLTSALASALLAGAALPSLAAATDSAGSGNSANMQVAHWEGRFHKGPPDGDDDRGAWRQGPGMPGDRGDGPEWKDGFGPGRDDGPGGGRGAMVVIGKFDANNDGSVSKDEIAAGLAGKTKAFDKDGDGAISLEEYKALWTDGMNEMIVRSFQRFDADGDGKVTVAEYQTPFDHMIAALDRNQDGTIDRNEMAGPGQGPGGGPMGHGRFDHHQGNGWGDDDDRPGPRGPMAD